MARGPESEFGVPFPGRVLPSVRWSRTGYRDDGKPFDWDLVFGRSPARVVDLGCGNGRYLIGSALSRPDRDHLGIDLVQRAIDFAAHRANKRGRRDAPRAIAVPAPDFDANRPRFRRGRKAAGGRESNGAGDRI